MAEQILCKGRAALIAEEVRKTLDGLGVVGQRMGLLVRDHLQPVLDPAQKLVGFGQFLARLKGDPVAGRENLQRLQRRAHPQFRMTAAGNQLLGLREKLDLADAAAADLDVMAFDRDLALAAIGLHLPLHVVDVGQCRKIQMLAPDERREFGDQRLARFGVAGARPRLDHRRAFPGPPFPLVIMQRRVGRNRHLRRGRIGPQAQIDAEHVAVAASVAAAAARAPASRARRTAPARCRRPARWRRDRKTRSGRCRWNSSVRPRPSCPWRARSGRSPPPAGHD